MTTERLKYYSRPLVANPERGRERERKRDGERKRKRADIGFLPMFCDFRAALQLTLAIRN